ncbi:TATA-box-binding protein [Halorarius litoreus]|jgi:transcription initiation factor TFIID TATA-box-binding protein|uniref:TATA-box-binding protein n=1 Tax=Halorarius litoreus TaxID=2962676 RepID=UPI0020CF3FA4|nr:TATA-box-binding protein [Halorarius litoreus]
MSSSTPTDTLSIENVVVSTGIDQELDLEQLADDVEQTEFDPERFPGLLYRTQTPEAAVLMFRSGKMVCTGAKSAEEANRALDTVFETLRSLGIDAGGTPDVAVENMVVGGELGQRLNLNAAAIGFGLTNIEYEPEQFPGLVYRFDDSSVVVLLFGSGQTIITGGSSIEEAEEAIDIVQNRLGDLGLLNQ